MQCRTCRGRGKVFIRTEWVDCKPCSGTGAEADPLVPDPMERIAAALERIADKLDALTSGAGNLRIEQP